MVLVPLISVWASKVMLGYTTLFEGYSGAMIFETMLGFWLMIIFKVFSCIFRVESLSVKKKNLTIRATSTTKVV